MSTDFQKIYQALIDSGLSENEIKQKIKTKAEEFKGFISREGILHLIANECGIKMNAELYNELAQEIDYDDFTINISEVKENMSNIVLLGRIARNFGIKNFIRKDGTHGLVGAFILSDVSAQIKVVLWDDQVNIMKNEFFHEGEIIRIIGGYSKKGRNGNIEIQVGKKGNIILSPKDVDKNKIPLIENNNSLSPKEISIARIQDLHNQEGFIDSVEGIIFKIEEFKEIDLKNGEKTFLLKLILKDETSSVIVNIWGMNAVRCLKIIDERAKVSLSNILVKFNSYTSQNEIYFTKKSTLELN